MGNTKSNIIIFLLTFTQYSCNHDKSVIKLKHIQIHSQPESDSSRSKPGSPEVMSPCGELAYKILETSKPYKELTNGLYERVIKNHGESYGILVEGIP